MIHYLQEQEGIHLEVKGRKVAWSAFWRCSICIFFEYFEGFSEHGIFHGITDLQENMPLNINDKKGFLIIEWE